MLTLNLNLKARMKNKTFWVTMASAIVLLIQQLGFKNLIPSNWSDVVNTLLGILVMLGVLVDPSTPGISDKTQPIGENDSGNNHPAEENKIDTEAMLKENEELKSRLNQIQTVVANNITSPSNS